MSGEEVAYRGRQLQTCQKIVSQTFLPNHRIVGGIMTSKTRVNNHPTRFEMLETMWAYCRTGPKSIESMRIRSFEVYAMPCSVIVMPSFPAQALGSRL